MSEEEKIVEFSPLTWEKLAASSGTERSLSSCEKSFPSTSASISYKSSNGSASYLNNQENAGLTPKINSKFSPVTPISTYSSKASSASSNYRKNAGLTPKKNSKVKNSLDIIRIKHDFNLQIERSESSSKEEIKEKKSSKNSLDIVRNSSNHVSQITSGSLSKENIKKSTKNSLDIIRKNFDHNSKLENGNLNKSKEIMAINFGQEMEIVSQASTVLHENTISEKSAPIVLSQFDVIPERNTDSFTTVDGFYESDVDMFDDFDSQGRKAFSIPNEVKKSFNLAEFSSEFEDKSKFEPPFCPLTTGLKNELQDASFEEIHQKVEDIIAFLENSD